MLSRILAIIGLQGFAVLTAMLHMHLGVHTDEAKYLMNIPYPHPPLLRWLMGMTDGWQYQEIFWRVFIASFLVHGVWLVADMARKCSREQRITLCGLWLFSGALLLQSGTVMMAPVTAVQTLFLCWMLSHPAFLKKWSVLIAALWLEMLFTAYQGILFAPLVWVALEQSKIGFAKRLSAFFLPIALLTLYTLTNPLAIAAMGFAGTMHGEVSFEDSLLLLLKIWVIGGSFVLSILGILGMIRSRNISLILSIVLLAMYVLLSSRVYYAILFTPLLIAGIVAQPKLLRSSAFILATQMVMGVALFLYIPFSSGSNARSIARELQNAAGTSGSVLIKGSFGHDWQYLIPGSVLRYNQQLLRDAKVVICRPWDACTESDRRMMEGMGFNLHPGFGDEVWVRTGK